VFGDAKFSGGTVDFKDVLDWSVPPTELPADGTVVRLPAQNAEAEEDWTS
jgi:hypothetical protein